MNENKKILLPFGFAIICILCVVSVIIYLASRNMTTSPSKTDSSTTTAPVTTRQPEVEIKPKPQQTTNETTTPPPTYCGVQDMPEGTCKVIVSIEQNGLKNNSLVSFDTSQLPDSAKVTTDRNSWEKSSETLSRINITIDAAGRKIAGLLYIQLVDGTWKATGYTIS